jgi:mannonate dehydratase
VRHCFAWSGPDDPVRLEDIRQAGAADIVSSLTGVPCGEPWSDGDIERRAREIALRGGRGEPTGLTWSIAGRLPVHDKIKLRVNGFRGLVEDYLESLANLARRGLKTVCTYFTPASERTRTSLSWCLPDGSRVTAYDGVLIAAYDILVLDRPGARDDYPEATVETAMRLFASMGKGAREALEEAVQAGLPAGRDGAEALRERLAPFRGVTRSRLRENLYAFLNAIAPLCEDRGIRIALHPDDPPLSVLGLPRALCTMEDVKALTAAVPSPSVGIVLCAGTFGARPDNDPVAIFERVAGRVHLVHMGNVGYLGGRDDAFHDSPSIRGAVDLPRLAAAILREEERRKALGRTDCGIPVCPYGGGIYARDSDGKGASGLSFTGRAVRLAELRGLEAGARLALSAARTEDAERA